MLYLCVRLTMKRLIKAWVRFFNIFTIDNLLFERFKPLDKMFKYLYTVLLSKNITLVDVRVEGGGGLLQQLVEVHPQPLPQVLQMNKVRHSELQ